MQEAAQGGCQTGSSLAVEAAALVRQHTCAAWLLTWHLLTWCIKVCRKPPAFGKCWQALAWVGAEGEYRAAGAGRRRGKAACRGHTRGPWQHSAPTGCGLSLGRATRAHAARPGWQPGMHCHRMLPSQPPQGCTMAVCASSWRGHLFDCHACPACLTGSWARRELAES